MVFKICGQSLFLNYVVLLLILAALYLYKPIINAYHTGTGSTIAIITGIGSIKFADNTAGITLEEVASNQSRRLDRSECNDPLWCTIPLPTKSYFSFGGDDFDVDRWEQAKLDAVNGRQVLLERIVQHFPNQLDFLDGDTSFRSIHKLADVFIDDRNYLKPLTSEYKQFISYRGNLNVPPPYDFRGANRAPIVQIGFFSFAKIGTTTFLEGSIRPKFNMFISKKQFFTQWQTVKHIINTPFVALMTLNENWGWFSTHYPNRTSDWGACCTKPIDDIVRVFLNDKNTLALVVNQHMNISHPKVISFPRGMPLIWEHTTRLIWDSMRASIHNVRKEKLLMAAASTWGPRPQILQCVSKLFDVKDFEGHLDSISSEDLIKKTDVLRTNRRLYYERLSAARFGLCLPGLGYDTFRTWEYLTMGTIAVLERSVGFERTMWRLPVLLVDDYAELTPTLLRAAYVEAMYRKDEFEFHRLKQSFWWSVISNVSASKSTEPLVDAFPMHAEDVTFTRPREPFTCWRTNSCGEGTKRIPRKSC